MTYGPILLKVSTKYLVTFVSVIRHEQSTRRATPFTFTYGFSLCRALLVVTETCPNSKISVTFVAGERTSENVHGVLVMQSLHVWSQTCVILLLQLMLQGLQTYFFAIAHVTFVITC